jgi:DNA polymerase
MMSTDRAAALGEIADQVKVCTLCDLYKNRTRAVPGAGSPNAEILFIGEGPGYNEDKQGLPFVGQSGRLLNELLKSIGLSRDDVFITNVVKCRPPQNRDPLPIEIATCRQYLDAQEGLIDPLVIVTLGRHSMARYFPGAKITAIHGQPKYDSDRAYMPLFHPAAVLRNPAYEQPMMEDFQRILEVLAEVKRRRAGGAPAEPAPTAQAPATEPPTPKQAAPKTATAPPAQAPQPPANTPPTAPDGDAADEGPPTQMSLF